MKLYEIDNKLEAAWDHVTDVIDNPDDFDEGTLAWLSLLFRLDVETALGVGFWPYLPANLVKIGLGAVILPTAWKLLGGRSSQRSEV